MAKTGAHGKYGAGCFYCGEGSCQEHFERGPEEKVVALVLALLCEGEDYYADVLEGRGYGPDWFVRIGGVGLVEEGLIEVTADGERILVEARRGASEGRQVGRRG